MKISKQEKNHVSKIINEIFSKTPVILFIGKCHSGKSSLGNTLFGNPTFEVGQGKAQTRVADFASIEGKTARMILLDSPGFGETAQKHEEYKELYIDILNNGAEISSGEKVKPDVIVWLFPASNADFQNDLDCYNDVFRNNEIPIVFTVSKCNSLDPLMGSSYDSEYSFKPSTKQLETLRIRKEDIASKFNIDACKIVGFTGYYDKEIKKIVRYNLEALLEQIILALPTHSVLKAAKDARDNRGVEVSHIAIEAAVKGIVKELARFGISKMLSQLPNSEKNTDTLPEVDQETDTDKEEDLDVDTDEEPEILTIEGEDFTDNSGGGVISWLWNLFLGLLGVKYW